MDPSIQLLFSNNPHKIFQAGSTLECQVKLTLHEITKISEIRLKVEGHGKCSFYGYSDGRRGRDTQGHEKYIDNSILLLKDVELSPGVFIYPANILLANNLPASVTLKEGKIKYKLEAILSRPWKLNKSDECDVTLVKPLDLNLNWVLTRPDKVDLEKVFYFCCFPSKPLCLRATISAKAAAPGETVDLTIKIDNKSSIEILKFKIFFMFIEKYSENVICGPKVAENHVSLLKQKVDVNERTVDRGPRQIVHKIVIPHGLHPTDINSKAKVIKFSYAIKITTVVQGFRSNFDMYIPLIVATAPYRTPPVQVQVPTAISNESIASGGNEPCAPLKMELPSYEQAMDSALKVDDAKTVTN